MNKYVNKSEITSNNINVDYLANHVKFIPTIADWYFSAFGTESSSIEKCTKIIQQRLNTTDLDICFLAFIENQIVGTVSLSANDIPKNPKMTPCISNLFVAEKYRHKGIGRYLIKYAKQKLKNMQFNKAYLYTTDESIYLWYELLGWNVIGDDIINFKKIKIMESKL